MCALCAVLGSSNHWSDMAGREEFRPGGGKVSRRAERLHRISLMQPVLDFYGLYLQDWGGSSYILSNRHGDNTTVYQLNGIWAAAERLAGRPCDPLDSNLLECLTRCPE